MIDIFRNLDRKISTRPLFFVYLLFLITQAILFLKIGVFTSLEAEKYVTQGNLLYETGRLSDTKYIFYLPVILFVYLCRLLGISYLPVVICQVALSGLSLLYFYRLGVGIGNKKVAVYSSILLALFIPLQIWNFYLYSDSIFISLTIIYSYLIYTFDKKGIKGTLIILAFLIVLCFSRPHGLLFIPPTIIYLLLRKQPSLMLIACLGLCLGLLIGMYILLNAAFTGGEDMDAMKPFIEEHVICFVPLKPEGADLDLIKTASPVNDIFYYIFHNPLHFLKLTILKLHSFFNMTRTYYSTGHNIMLSLILIPVYIFGLIGLFRFVRPFKNFTLFLISLLLLYPLGATFQCDDWHSRFTMVVFPYFILLACMGFALIFGKKSLES